MAAPSGSDQPIQDMLDRFVADRERQAALFVFAGIAGVAFSLVTGMAGTLSGLDSVVLFIVIGLLFWKTWREEPPLALATRRYRFWPFMGLVTAAIFAALVAMIGFGFLLGLKDAGFVWDALPTERFQGRAYRWPGLYVQKFLVPPPNDSGDWYVNGGPYTPLPSDTVDQAAERLRIYLHDRFDLDVPHADIRNVLLGAPPPKAGSHPHTPGVLAVESAYSGATRRVILDRLLFDVMLVLALAGVVLRLMYARRIRLPLLVCLLASIVWGLGRWWPGIFFFLPQGSYAELHEYREYFAFRAMVRVYRFHAAHFWEVNLAAAGSYALMILWCRRAHAVDLRRQAELEP